MATQDLEKESAFSPLDIFVRVEQEICLFFDTILQTVSERRDQLLSQLKYIKLIYLDKEKMRKKQVRELKEIIQTNDKMRIEQNPIVKLQGDYLQRMNNELTKYQQPTQIPIPGFSSENLQSLLRQLEKIGSVQEVTRLYHEKMNPIATFGKLGSKKGEFNWPHGICVERNIIYICDYFNTRVQTFSKEGKFISEFGKGQLERPYGIALYDKWAFVSDNGQNAICKFQVDNQKFVCRSEPGKLSLPRGLTLDLNGEVFVADHENHRIAILNSDLHFLREFGKPKLKYPCDVKTHRDEIFVVDYGKPHNVHVFSKSADLLYSLINLRNGSAHIFMCIDQFGNLILSDSPEKTIQIYTAEGHMKNYIKCEGYVRGVEVASDNTILCCMGDPHCLLLY